MYTFSMSMSDEIKQRETDGYIDFVSLAEITSLSNRALDYAIANGDIFISDKRSGRGYNGGGRYFATDEALRIAVLVTLAEQTGAKFGFLARVMRNANVDTQSGTLTLVAAA